jgi:hypothetical protein
MHHSHPVFDEAFLEQIASQLSKQRDELERLRRSHSRGVRNDGGGFELSEPREYGRHNALDIFKDLRFWGAMLVGVLPMAILGAILVWRDSWPD